MKTILWRTSSGQIVAPSIGLCSPRTLSDQYFINGVSFPARSGSASPRTPLHFDAKDAGHFPVLRRARSEADLILSERSDSGVDSGLKQLASSGFIPMAESKKPSREIVRILEEEEEDEGALMIGREIWNLSGAVTGKVLTEELGFGGGESGKGRNIGGGGGRRGEGSESSSGRRDNQSEIAAYYKEMLKANPGNPLLLMNYGKYLQEVEKDAAQAEEYYGRAILASPGDAEALSLYAKLIWDVHRDEKRAESYFDQAIRAAPDDCYVLGSYAHFLWDAEEEEEKNLEKEMKASPLIAAY